MSEEEQTITKVNTTEKVKNPKRILQGKRLAEMSRSAKLKKQKPQEKFSEEEAVLQLPGVSTSLTLIGVATGVIGTYIAWKRYKHDTKKPDQKQNEPKTTTKETLQSEDEDKVEPTTSQVKYNNLDDDDI